MTGRYDRSDAVSQPEGFNRQAEDVYPWGFFPRPQRISDNDVPPADVFALSLTASILCAAAPHAKSEKSLKIFSIALV